MQTYEVNKQKWNNWGFILWLLIDGFLISVPFTTRHLPLWLRANPLLTVKAVLHMRGDARYYKQKCWLGNVIDVMTFVREFPQDCWAGNAQRSSHWSLCGESTQLKRQRSVGKYAQHVVESNANLNTVGVTVTVTAFAFPFFQRVISVTGWTDIVVTPLYCNSASLETT